ncbi:hypothetical protein G5S35_30080 [Paraburkholderia tropica]|uniref:hypothetical protein n=1 Tax=Paraburkholderia tropica TaxID=92647 RepID=UPI001601A64A|nr:hypothetical protein [Paraburkholderia tropica]QNB15816.1 hypothetical protein G5S35_30080 [Paraburkholderia tropica]
MRESTVFSVACSIELEVRWQSPPGDDSVDRALSALVVLVVLVVRLHDEASWSIEK